MLAGPAMDAANQSAWDARLLAAQEARDGAAAQVRAALAGAAVHALALPAAAQWTACEHLPRALRRSAVHFPPSPRSSAPQELLAELHAELTTRPDWEAAVQAIVAQNEGLLSELTDDDPLVRLQGYM